MQAIHVHQFGGPEQLRLEELPRPRPGTGEVLVRVLATGVLPIEWKVRQGLFQRFMPTTFPYIPGSAFAGVIEEAGEGVDTYQIGQAVFGRSSRGAYAEYTATSLETIAPLPEGLSFEEAATLSGGATTAWTALFEGNGELQAGQRVLIHGAAGGVGLFAVQFARRKGAHVIATAAASNHAFVQSLGAQTVIDYTTIPFEQQARDVDVVLDTIGGETLQRSLRVVRPGGVLVSLLEEPHQETARSLGIRAMKNTATLPYPSRDLLETLAQLVASGEVKTFIRAAFPLREAPLAHELGQTGHGRGRIILRINS